MITDPLYLVIDQGGHSTRAMVFDRRGAIQAVAQESVSMNTPADDWVEQSAAELLQSSRDVLVSVAEELGDSVHRLSSCAVATQRSNIVCWDSQSGAALSPAISWQDRRAQAWVQQFHARQMEVHEKTGLLVSAHYGASKLHWCLENLPAVQQAYAEQRLCWGPLASYLVAQLTGEPHKVDPANAARTLLWNLKTQQWDPDLCRLFEVPMEPLPQCVHTVARYGDISLGGCHVPLKVVTGDQSAALYGFGKPQADSAYINIGTGAFVQVPTANDLYNVPGLLSGIVYSDGVHSEYVLECTVNGAASALTQYEQLLGISGREAAANFEQWLEQAKNPPLFLNGVAGLGAPYWVADFKSDFVESQGSQAEDWQRLVAVAESIVFLIARNLQHLQQANIKLQRLVVSGGLSYYQGLCQRLADLSGIAVCRPHLSEATCRGLAYLLAGCPGQWPDHEQGHWFSPANNVSLHERYEHWVREMESRVSQYHRVHWD